MRRFSTRALSARLPVDRRRFDENAGATLSQHRGTEPERVQKDYGRDVQRPRPTLFQTATHQFGQLHADYGSRAQIAQ